MSQNYEERPYLQIDLFEVQREWEWHEQQKKQQEAEKKIETVIVIDI